MAQEAITFVTEAEIAEGERLIDKPLADCSLTEKLILSIIENHPLSMTLQSRALGNHPAQTVIMNCRSQQKLTAIGLSSFHGETIDLDHAILPHNCRAVGIRPPGNGNNYCCIYMR